MYRVAVTDGYIFPEKDPLQKGLCGLMEHKVRVQAHLDGKDDKAEVDARNALLSESETARKTAALELKRQQVHTVAAIKKTIGIGVQSKWTACDGSIIFTLQSNPNALMGPRVRSS